MDTGQGTTSIQSNPIQSNTIQYNTDLHGAVAEDAAPACVLFASLVDLEGALRGARCGAVAGGAFLGAGHQLCYHTAVTLRRSGHRGHGTGHTGLYAGRW